MGFVQCMEAQALRRLADEGRVRVLCAVQPRRGHAHHAGLGAAVEEKLEHRIAEVTILGQPAELAFVAGKIQDPDRSVERSAHGRAQKCGYRSGHAGNSLRASGRFLDIHPGMIQGRRHELLLSTATRRRVLAAGESSRDGQSASGKGPGVGATRGSAGVWRALRRASSWIAAERQSGKSSSPGEMFYRRSDKSGQ